MLLNGEKTVELRRYAIPDRFLGAPPAAAAVPDPSRPTSCVRMTDRQQASSPPCALQRSTQLACSRGGVTERCGARPHGPRCGQAARCCCSRPPTAKRGAPRCQTCWRTPGSRKGSSWWAWALGGCGLPGWGRGAAATMPLPVAPPPAARQLPCPTASNTHLAVCLQAGTVVFLGQVEYTSFEAFAADEARHRVPPVGTPYGWQQGGGGRAPRLLLRAHACVACLSSRRHDALPRTRSAALLRPRRRRHHCAVRLDRGAGGAVAAGRAAAADEAGAELVV